MKIPDTDLYYPPPFLYCGPTTLCAITGAEYYEQIRPVINAMRGRRSNAGVTGMKNAEMVRVLAHFGRLASVLGWERDWIWIAPAHRPRLPDALRALYERGDARPGDILVVETTRHYVTVQNNVVVDNHAIDSLIRHPARRQMARRAWRIVPNPQWHIAEVRRAA